MRVWVEDFNFHLARALRVVGVGLAAVAWASVIGSEAQQPADTRAYLQVAAAVGNDSTNINDTASTVIDSRR